MRCKRIYAGFFANLKLVKYIQKSLLAAGRQFMLDNAVHYYLS